MADPVRIGEGVRRAGFTVKALRYHDLHGLLPQSARTSSGYRLYDDVDLHRLAFIRQAKALGFALDEIRWLVDAARSQDAATRPRPEIFECNGRQDRQRLASRRSLSSWRLSEETSMPAQRSVIEPLWSKLRRF